MSQLPITVIGSSNTDMVIKSSRLPAAGETILGGHFFMNAGGKGANQAVAAVRLGGNVSLIAKVGDDIFGQQALRQLKAEGIDISAVMTDATAPSGVALITVNEQGENCIVVAAGANGLLSPEDLKIHELKILSAGLVLMQLETPLETIAFAARKAFEQNITVVLNPAPACALPDSIFEYISIITPNETEAEMLTGIPVSDLPSARQAALSLQRKGVRTVIITMGSKGALLLVSDEFLMIEATVVNAIDSTAAGDVFNGALVVAIAEGIDLQEAVGFACRAAAISVTRLGAQSSAPYRKEIDTQADHSNF